MSVWLLMYGKSIPRYRFLSPSTISVHNVFWFKYWFFLNEVGFNPQMIDATIYYFLILAEWIYTFSREYFFRKNTHAVLGCIYVYKANVLSKLPRLRFKEYFPTTKRSRLLTYVGQTMQVYSLTLNINILNIMSKYGLCLIF